MLWKTKSLPSIEAKELIEKIKNQESLVLLDVRTQREWLQTGIIEGSILIEIKDIQKHLENGNMFNENQNIVVICRSGSRSSQVTRFLIDQYNLKAINLKGGIISWHHAGGNFVPISS